MIHEWRSYRLKPGAAGDYLTLLAERGLPLVTRHLPLMGYWLAETGPLNTIHHLWSYADWTERESRRAALAQEEGWTRGFIPAAFALVDAQQNRFLRLDRASPRFHAALAGRLRAHAAPAPGAALFAADCAALVIGADPAGAEALWQPVSGDARGPVALMPRSAEPVPAAPQPGRHVILRPLAFSPL
ncbi:NIPSNAP family protein [Paracoccus sp. P2]|uniref:NIPSNAP family protein n=1 Tax=Paracoccus pantotrophus TaxID=82367 RepID=A0A7H9BSK5_PARPN|nr:NIPSNAP family protein [Paracoccus pantotrophus]MDF3855600.1 NIPSNAP family protein [Paracoccus pantotrophus]QLH13825.1 NIPSNAP family protein [Paracoccus pantotrophus]RDD96246.1 NIPSNAP family protein [Paracoccus pantotrophus]RNI17551.1 NIPSNAP family protein [Paracoccus pantotrophus]WGR67039.1 NIPSNAP family protein [Paracoccus pantotrophus]